MARSNLVRYRRSLNELFGLHPEFEILGIITDRDIGRVPRYGLPIANRVAARVIVLQRGLASLIKVSREEARGPGYYKEGPGGEREPGETLRAAALRECGEELGGTVQIDGKLGVVGEIRTSWNARGRKVCLVQASFCFYGHVMDRGERHLTAQERAVGLEIERHTLPEALKRIEETVPQGYEGRFVRKRAMMLLHEFNRRMENEEIRNAQTLEAQRRAAQAA